jgi:hypothetical protein
MIEEDIKIEEDKKKDEGDDGKKIDVLFVV